MTCFPEKPENQKKYNDDTVLTMKNPRPLPLENIIIGKGTVKEFPDIEDEKQQQKEWLEERRKDPTTQ